MKGKKNVVVMVYSSKIDGFIDEVQAPSDSLEIRLTLTGLADGSRACLCALRIGDFDKVTSFVEALLLCHGIENDMSQRKEILGIVNKRVKERVAEHAPNMSFRDGLKKVMGLSQGV